MKNSITARLASLLAITFLPVNLLAIVVCSIIINQSSNQIQESYQRELDTAMNRMVSDLNLVEERLSDFLIRYMTELTLEGADGSMITLEMLGDYYAVWRNSGRSGMAYFYDKKTGRLYLKYTAGSYGIQ